MTDSILIIPILCAAFYYLGARAAITAPLWSRYPAWLDVFMSCAACSGFWYGLMLGIGAAFADVPFLGIRGAHTPLIIGLMSIWWTPVLADMQERALKRLGGDAGPSVDYRTIDQSVDVGPAV